MINIKVPKDCCGCTACYSICKHGAISMKPDALGFSYPVVDESKCIDCGLCEKVCSFSENYDKSYNLTKLRLYGARHKDISEVDTSRSGAVFSAIVEYVLGQSGVIYGVGYEDHFHVVHKRAATIEEARDFKGSKYVQSELRDTFLNVKKDLSNGLLVLFSGTPCQVVGLSSFIGKKYRERLVLVDIVCHGVPSPYIWKDYLAHIEEINHGKAMSVDFRNKIDYGWHDHKESFTINSKKITTEWFKRAFYKHIMLRHSCANCHFCNTVHPSDITLADFWGWEKTGTKLNEDNKGISLIFVNTAKGDDVFCRIKDSLHFFSTTLDKCLQPNMEQPTSFHPKREQFETDYKKKGFLYVYSHLDMYDVPSLQERFVSNVKRTIKKLIKK